VATEYSIKSVTAGLFHTCAKTTANRAYCWGYNWDGQLGDGTRNQRLAPTTVLGGMYFSQLDAGAEHTCGRSAGGVAYCWGANGKGTLGDGTTEVRLTPTAVLGPS
jgi:alpha-tubulin suppressor-like RCC1 family protein